MITIHKFKEILSKGLTVDHYVTLALLNNGESLPPGLHISGYVNLLRKRGYINKKSNDLTIEGLTLLNEFNPLDEVTVQSTTTLNPTKVKFGEWVSSVYLALQMKLEDLTGKKQFRAKLDGKSFNFLCNEIDLGKKLKLFISTYKVKDLKLIEESLLKYVERCYQANSWFPLIQYYIYKDGKSELATDLASPDADDSPSGKPDYPNPTLYF